MSLLINMGDIMFYGLFPLPWWGYLVVGLVFVQITIMCVTLYLHRAQAHRAIEFHPAVAHFFRLWLWLTTGMSTRAWAAVHRKHHAKCEQEEDPHSPMVLGIDTVLWQGAELYRRETSNPETIRRYGYGTPCDKLEEFYEKKSTLGIYLCLTIDLILFGVPGLTMWAVQMMWIPFFAAGVINGIGHYWGYRNFQCEDTSTNISPWGLFIGGEELHNNHHAFPTAAKFSLKWWEVDIGWGYIQIFRLLGLVKVKKLAPKLKITPQKKMVDVDTLKAVVTNRLQVLSRYYKYVIMPIWRMEKVHASQAKKLKGWINRAEKMVSADEQKQLDSALAEYKTLQKVYEFRHRLQAIWGRTTASHKELVEALQEWCKQAEASGIAVLQQFSVRLRQFA